MDEFLELMQLVSTDTPIPITESGHLPPELNDFSDYVNDNNLKVYVENLKNSKSTPELRQLFESQIIGPKNGKGNVHANNSVKYIKMIFLDVNNKKCRVDSILPL
uniref:Uncharacterized protein n=1 Tax=Pylaiella littoralis TaxID=2885 RepID=O78802_PYLLI|nr:unknown [Pylaiella littoralis]